MTDQTEAALPGVIVTATSVDTGLSRSVDTDPSGNYFFSELPLGEYTVTATLPGFAPQTVKAVEVEASRSRRVDIQLHPGGVQESVEVVAGSPLVDSTRNVQGGTIDGEQAAEIPLNGRDFTKLLSLVPGTAADPSGINDSPGSFGLFSINGNRGRSNNYLLDGTDMNDGYRNLPAINEGGVFGTPATVLPIDAVAEFPILSGAEAEYGRNAGAHRQHRHEVGHESIWPAPHTSSSATMRWGRGISSTSRRRRKTSSGTTSSADRLAVRSRPTRRSTSWPTRDSVSTAGFPGRHAFRPTARSSQQSRQTAAS